MFAFKKTWRTSFFCSTRFEIRHFAFCLINGDKLIYCNTCYEKSLCQFNLKTIEQFEIITLLCHRGVFRGNIYYHLCPLNSFCGGIWSSHPHKSPGITGLMLLKWCSRCKSLLSFAPASFTLLLQMVWYFNKNYLHSSYN